jgi:hypothetical protein
VKNFALIFANVEEYFLLRLADGGRSYQLPGTILGHASTRELLPPIAALLLFAAFLLPISFAIFRWALRRMKITGRLTHF